MPGDTKSKIIELLNEKEMTLTELSQKLSLAPSTINQHLKELLAVGAIRQIPNEFIIKQKYYEVNPDYKTKRAMAEQSVSTNTLDKPSFKIAAGLALIIIVAALLYEFGLGRVTPSFGSTSISGPQVPAGATVFSISDTPTVSTVGAVNVTVNSAEVHSTITNKWYTVLSTPRFFNLVALRNISSILGIANVPAGNYNEFVLNISNVSAVVNNVSTSVFIPDNRLDILGNFNITANSSASPCWVNLDVNLDKSLHLTGTGIPVLLPVLRLSSSVNTNLSIAPNGIVGVRRWGHVRSQINASMDQNGNFTSPQTVPVSAGENLNVTSNGKIILLPGVQSTIVIRGQHKLIFITNVTNATSMIQNLTTQINTSTGIAVSGIAIPPTPLQCKSLNRFVDCQTSNDITVNATVPPIIGPCPLYCQTGVGIPHNYRCPPCPPPTRVNITNTTISITTMPCFSCPGVVVTTNGTSMCTPPPTSGQAWPTYRCYQTTNVIVNASNPSNLPQQVNASFASCQTSLQCVIVPRYPCQNLPQQSACINQAYLTQYYQWYQSVYGKFGVAMGARTANQGGISTVVGATTNVSVSTNSSTSIPNFYACPLYVIAYQHKYCGCSTSNICTLYVTEYPPPNVIAPTP